MNKELEKQINKTVLEFVHCYGCQDCGIGGCDVDNNTCKKCNGTGLINFEFYGAKELIKLIRQDTINELMEAITDMDLGGGLGDIGENKIKSRIAKGWYGSIGDGTC